MPLTELTSSSDEVLLAAHTRDVLVDALRTALNHPACPEFELLFERAARWSVPASPSERVSWVNRYAASARGIPDAVPRWDIVSREWILAWARSTPEELRAHREALDQPLQTLADFCFALVGGGPMPSDVAAALAKHYLNAPPSGFAYEGLISLEQLAGYAERALADGPFPILRRPRVEELAKTGDVHLVTGLAVNYCASDFRRVGVGLIMDAYRVCTSRVNEAFIEGWAARTRSPEGKIVLSLVYAQISQLEPGAALPEWVVQSLLLDLRSGTLDDVDVTREALLALPNDVARHLLGQALREERATLLIPALADEGVLHEFLSRVEAGDVRRETAVEALAHCGQDGLAALLSFEGCAKSVSKVTASLGTVVAEALGRLLGRGNAAHAERAAEVLVPWLGHTSKAVSGAAKRTLEGMGAEARSALERGLGSTKKQVRQEVERLLERLNQQQSVVATPLDSVRDKAAQQAEAGKQFLQLCREVYQRSENWAATLRPFVQQYGASCLEWLRPWFDEHMPQGDVRLWCYVVDLLSHDTDAVWVATDTFARMPKLPTSLWARPRRALSKLGDRLAAPAKHVLSHGPTEYAEPIYGLLAAHAGEESIELLLAALASDSKAIRGHAVDGLSRVDNAPLEPVLELLSANNPGVRISAAELLAVWGRPGAEAALSDSLARESRAPVRAYLEEALAATGACPLWDSTPNAPRELAPDAIEGRLDESLRQRAVGMREPRFLWDHPLPPLAYKSGRVLDVEAALGFLSLVSQLDSTLKGRLVRQISARLEPSALAAWSRHLHERWSRSKDTKLKWAIYQVWLLADEALVDEVAASIAQLRANEHVVLACYLRVLHWRASRRALDWLVHWSNALHSRGARTLAQTLLGRVAYRSGQPLQALRDNSDQWVYHRHYEQSLANKPELERFDTERFVQYLEDCLVTGRTWTWLEWSALNERFAELFKALVWRVHFEQDGLHAFDVSIARRGVFQSDTGERIEGDATSEIALAHPVFGDPLAWRKVRQWLADKVNDAPLPLWERPIYRYGGEKELVLADVVTDSERLDRWIKRRGWFHGEPLDHGLVYSNTKTLGAKRLVFQLNHSGYPIGQHEFAERVHLHNVEIFDLDGKPVELSKLGEQTYSELCYQLRQLSGDA